MNVEVIRISSKEALPIRHQVLWPSKPESFCRIDGDETAWHFGALVDGQLVCCASVFVSGHEARLRKFATLASFQGKGIGSKVIDRVFAELKAHQYRYFWCDARESALAFYQRLGMTKTGERFYKSEEAYFKMSIEL
ncbi:GNAT family N-acetyltransferase [Vibrio profundi]|uniref:GNAT family N-acetyltransferase n=1 Tax=Vibrio profundi TaxID=1774960 RepID=UPI003734F5D3